MFSVIRTKKIWFALSGILVAASIISFVVFGFNLGIDFKGGSLLDLKFSKEVTSDQITEALSSFDIGNVTVQPTEEDEYFIRFGHISEDQHQEILSTINSKLGRAEELRYETIGPTIGRELREKAIYAIIVALIAIVLYIAYAFRKVSKPVASWKYGLTAIVALFHDIIIVTGLFVALGHFLGVEIDTLFVTALLAILGFSVHDTIVVFDRTRYNLIKRTHAQKDFDSIVDKSIGQTAIRSINTSLTTFFVLLALYLFGGESIKFFVLALMAGIAVGTYSSIFLASPLLVVWEKLSHRK